MNGRLSKKIRKLIYGEEYSSRERKYRLQEHRNRSGIVVSRTLKNIGRRRDYQLLKKKYKELYATD